MIWRRVRRRFGIGALVALVSVVAGVGCYLIATSKRVDVDAAQVAATRAGEKRGKAQGTREGFAQGFKSGRADAYQTAYRAAYVAAYRSEFERAGLSAPGEVTVKGP